jgi:hypothetical protein
MKQKFLLLTLAFLFLGSVSFHQSIACDAKPKKTISKAKPAVAKKKTGKATQMPFDVFPFTHSILIN